MALSRSPVRAAAGTLAALHAPELTVWAIRGDREMYCSRLSVRPAPAGRGGCVPGFWLEQAYADQPAVVIDALDRVSGQLELGDDGGRERNPAGVQLGKTDRLVAGLAQSLQQPLLLDVSERHRRIGDLQRDCGRLERFQATLLAPDVWRLGVWSPSTAPAAVDSRALRSSSPTPPARASSTDPTRGWRSARTAPARRPSRTAWTRAPLRARGRPQGA